MNNNLKITFPLLCDKIYDFTSAQSQMLKCSLLRLVSQYIAPFPSRKPLYRITHNIIHRFVKVTLKIYFYIVANYLLKMKTVT